MFQSKRGTVSGYFLAGRFMTFLPVSFLKFNSKLIQFNTNLIDIEYSKDWSFEIEIIDHLSKHLIFQNFKYKLNFLLPERSCKIRLDYFLLLFLSKFKNKSTKRIKFSV